MDEKKVLHRNLILNVEIFFYSSQVHLLLQWEKMNHVLLIG